MVSEVLLYETSASRELHMIFLVLAFCKEVHGNVVFGQRPFITWWFK